MRRMVSRGVVNEEQIRSIYKSGTFPTAAFGLVYNLEPSLAAKVREAFFSYVWAGTALESKSLFKPCTKLPDQALHAQVLSFVLPQPLNATGTNVFQTISSASTF